MTRMREQLLDVDLVVPRQSIEFGGGFAVMMPDLMRRAREQAVARAAEVKGEVRSTLMPEVVMREAVSPLLGDIFVLGTRWLCDVPEAALTSAER